MGHCIRTVAAATFLAAAAIVGTHTGHAPAPADAPRAEAHTFRLDGRSGARVGYVLESAGALPLDFTCAPSDDGRRVAFDRGSLVESYVRLGPGAVEQTFEFERVPDGDLVVRGRFETSLTPRLHAGRVLFDDERGTRFQYRDAFVVDAAGRRASIDIGCDGARTWLTVPAAWLASAVAPVVIDPVLEEVADASAEPPLEAEEDKAMRCDSLFPLTVQDSVDIQFENRTYSYEDMRAMAVDEEGNLYVGGQTARDGWRCPHNYVMVDPYLNRLCSLRRIGRDGVVDWRVSWSRAPLSICHPGGEQYVNSSRDYDRVLDLAASGSKVLVLGSRNNPPPTESHLFLELRDASTGTPIGSPAFLPYRYEWTPNGLYARMAVDWAAGRIYVAVSLPYTGNTMLHVRAYELAPGGPGDLNLEFVHNHNTVAVPYPVVALGRTSTFGTRVVVGIDRHLHTLSTTLQQNSYLHLGFGFQLHHVVPGPFGSAYLYGGVTGSPGHTALYRVDLETTPPTLGPEQRPRGVFGLGADPASDAITLEEPDPAVPGYRGTLYRRDRNSLQNLLWTQHVTPYIADGIRELSWPNNAVAVARDGTVWLAGTVRTNRPVYAAYDTDYFAVRLTPLAEPLRIWSSATLVRDGDTVCIAGRLEHPGMQVLSARMMMFADAAGNHEIGSSDVTVSEDRTVLGGTWIAQILPNTRSIALRIVAGCDGASWAAESNRLATRAMFIEVPTQD